MIAKNLNRRWGIVLIALCLAVCSVHPVYGADADPSSGKWTKLGRGVSNIALSPTEVVYQPYFMAQHERFPIALFGGVGRGIAYMIGRIAVGLYETLTFPVPLPSGYRPIIQPDTPIPRDVDSGSDVV